MTLCVGEFDCLRSRPRGIADEDFGSPLKSPEPLLITDKSRDTSMWTCWGEPGTTIEIASTNFFPLSTTMISGSSFTGSITHIKTQDSVKASTLVTQVAGSPGVFRTIIATTTPTTSSSSFENDPRPSASTNSLSTGAKAGIALGGGFGAFAVLVVLLYCAFRYMKKSGRRPSLILHDRSWPRSPWKSTFEKPDDVGKAKSAPSTPSPPLVEKVDAKDVKVNEASKQHSELGGETLKRPVSEVSREGSELDGKVMKRPISEMPVSDRQSMLTELSSQPARDRMSELAG